MLDSILRALHAPGATVSRGPRRWSRRSGTAAAAVALTVLVAGPAAAATSTLLATGITSPLGSIQLTGADGLKHQWISDHLNGLCRLDPAPGGGLVENSSSCVLFFGKNAIKAGELSFDPSINEIYVPDLEAKSLGVLRFGYDPTANAGLGGISLFDRTQLVSNCGLGGNLPWASALGPDGDLYIVGKKSPNILRIHNPGTVGSVSASCGADVQNIGNVADGKKGFQLAFVGHNLWETDGFAMGVIQDAVAKARPAGTTIVDTSLPAGNQTRTFVTATAPQNATSVFVGVSPAATALTATGQVLLVGNATSVTVINLANGGSFATLPLAFQFVQSISVNATDGAGLPTNVTVTDDPSNGTLNSQGRLWSVTLP